MEIPLPGEALRVHGSMVNDHEIWVERQLLPCVAEAAMEGRFPEAFPQQVCMLENSDPVVHGIVGRNLVGLTSSERRRERGITQEKDRPVPRRRSGIVID